MVKRDGMEVYSGEDVDLDFEKSAKQNYRYIDSVRKRLLGRIIPRDVAIKTEEEIHEAFYFAGNRKVNGIGASRVLNEAPMRLPLSEKRDLCFKPVDLGVPRRYFVYVEKKAED